LMAAATLGGFIGPIFAGGVYDVMDSYRLAFLLLTLTTCIGAGVVLMMGRPPARGAEAAHAPAA
jgi:MFS family permease